MRLNYYFFILLFIFTTSLDTTLEKYLSYMLFLRSAPTNPFKFNYWHSLFIYAYLFCFLSKFF